MSSIRARTLRRQATHAEKLLWAQLRHHQLGGSHFRRQHPIGPYFADFCCIQWRLLVELDGGQHVQQAGYDQQRSSWLTQQGFLILRFWNSEVVHQLPGVVERISQAIQARRLTRERTAEL